ncbi:MAG: DUF1775 domain-containing protein, partial [Actinopolymorphaceae bacterium]
IGPDEFDEFEVSVGPLPEEESMAFPAVQTYDDGEVVEWSDPVREGAAEPEHPAPVLTLATEEDTEDAQDVQGSAADGAEPAADKEETGSAQAADADAAEASGSSDQTARLLGGAGLGAGVLGLAAALVVLLTVRRRDAG